MRGLTLASVRRWAPHPSAAPVTKRSAADALVIAANGTRTCVGGWQLSYRGATPGKAYRVQVDARYEDVADPRDTLLVTAYWGRLKPNEVSFWYDTGILAWRYLLPEPTGERSLRFHRLLVAPRGADRLLLRCTFRWAAVGVSRWVMPVIRPARWRPRRPVRVCVATGARDGKPARSSTIEQNVQYYGALCRQACRDVRPDLIVLPEIALQYGLRRSPLETAVPAPGRETQPFQQIARSGRCRIALGMLERDGDAVYNSVALISPRGRVDGRYRKVHLAVGQEIHSGIRGGDGFPVFDTEAGRIGVNICMDSSAAESSRMAGLNGADILLLPIMGDHRAWFTFERRFDVDRWRCIMRTRAMDNQFCLAVARNAAEGSCIINRIGDILAWNDGTRDFIHAVVPLDEDLPTCNNGCYADVNWMQRRVCAYAGAEDPWRLGRVALP